MGHPDAADAATSAGSRIRALRSSAGIALALLLASLPMAVAAQRANELRLADGRVVEVIGLKRWTIAMIQDSLARYSPGDSLQSRACAAILRYKLHFADAAATVLIDGPTQPRVVVTVREPQDSARVQYRELPLDTARGRADWAPASDLLRRAPGLFEMAARGLFLGGPRNPRPRFRNSTDSIAAASVADFLRVRTSNQDRRDALAALDASSKLYDRIVAALILANFTDSDDTWYALVDALRESDGATKDYATIVLQTAATRTHRAIDWRPQYAAIHAILDGTSLFALPDFMDVLRQTGVGPADAAPLLKGGAEILLAYLQSDTPYLAYRSHELLVKLHGSDLGMNVEPWREWIDGL